MTAAKLKKGILVVLKYFTLILGAFVSILPLVVCVITAFKSPEEYASTNVMTLPKSWTYVENFIQAWKQANMGVAFRNSFIILVFVLAGSILTGSMIASGLCADEHFISVWMKFFPEKLAEIAFCTAISRPIIIGKVKMSDSIVKSGKAHLLHIFVDTCITKIVPESK